MEKRLALLLIESRFELRDKGGRAEQMQIFGDGFEGGLRHRGGSSRDNIKASVSGIAQHFSLKYTSSGAVPVSGGVG
jgi:hypothetical protein